MTDDRFHHHAYLQRVADEDVRFVLEKDTSYGASWKASGGRSAWYMLVRKIDRLRVLMQKPEAPHGFSLEDLLDAIPADGAADCTLAACVVRYLADSYTAENIFAMIRRSPSGDDGTVLAEVRDLRRYLLLVEAEMMARGVVAAPPPPDISELLPHPPPAQPGVPEGGVRLQDILHSNEHDSSRHATLTPWAVSMRWRYKHDMQPGGRRQHLFDAWYVCVAPGTWRLEASVCMTCCPSECSQCYDVENTQDTTLWILALRHLPPELRFHYPVLRRELNATEYAGLQPWQQALYAWSDERSGNYVIKPMHEAWTHGEEEEAVA